MDDWIDSSLAQAASRVRAIAAEVVDFPHITERGRWKTTPDGVWTGGFWAGLLWLVHQVEPSDADLQRALAYTERLLPRAHDTHNHDLGFMFFPSAIKGWHVTGDDRYRAAAVTAAESLASQFNTTAGFIPGWGFFGTEDWAGSVLVDTLMNLPLLAWATRHGGPPSLMEVVRRHAATALQHHLRADGSVFHVYRFDPASGTPLGGDTYQGLAADSAWARGQAWAITGLAILATMTGEAVYREASQRVAAYFLSHLPTDGVPLWDFQAAGADEPKDASASAIAAYGLLKLHRLTNDSRCLADAKRLLKALHDHCANRGQTGGVLLHATADLPHGLGIDESTMYGDYYYVKALVALRGLMGHG